MKKTCSLFVSAIFGLLLAVSVTFPAYSGGEEDTKLARYGQYGGPFTLIDHNGKTITDRDLLGHYVLMFFGYTYCPDVCPTTMQEVSDVLDLLGEKGRTIQPVFVSVDPERDTSEALAEYVSHFHPRMLGLTGPKEQITALADDYGVTYYKVFTTPETNMNSGEDGNGDYVIDHSAALYLMGPDGKFITLFLFGMPQQDIVQKIRGILE